jgi:hypothetical protein
MGVGTVAPIRFARPHADVAQLVEHFTRNEGVRGSSPRVGSLGNRPQVGGFVMRPMLPLAPRADGP